LRINKNPKVTRATKAGAKGDGDAGFDGHDWEGAEKLTEEEAKQVKQDVTEAIRQGSMLVVKQVQEA
jgi:hypothetical protein